MNPATTHSSAVRFSWRWIIAGVIGIAVLVALPRVLDPYQTLLVAYGLTYAIAALGFNLLLGYTGLLSFGHSAFFGAGAYTVALLSKYLKLESMEVFVVAGLAVAIVLAALFGFVCVRYTRIFFSILTLALSQVLWSLVFKFYSTMGGTDGIRVTRPTLLAGTVRFTGGRAFLDFIGSYYYYVLAIFVLCAVVMWLIVHSPFGLALQAIRDNEIRAEFVGVRVWQYRWVAFMLSGAFTGLAGALWVPLNGITTPDVLHWSFSGELVFLTVLGGFRDFAGPILGALIFTYLKTYAIAATEYWQFLLGTVLVVLVMVLPTGIVGLLNAVTTRLNRRS